MKTTILKNTHHTGSELFMAFDEVDGECINHRFVARHPDGRESVFRGAVSQLTPEDGSCWETLCIRMNDLAPPPRIEE